MTRRPARHKLQAMATEAATAKSGAKKAGTSKKATAGKPAAKKAEAPKKAVAAKPAARKTGASKKAAAARPLAKKTVAYRVYASPLAPKHFSPRALKAAAKSAMKMKAL